VWLASDNTVEDPHVGQSPKSSVRPLQAAANRLKWSDKA